MPGHSDKLPPDFQKVYNAVQKINEGSVPAHGYLGAQNMNEHTQELFKTIESWKGGGQKTIRDQMLKYVNESGKHELTPPAQLLMKGVKFSEPTKYPLYRGMSFSTKDGAVKFLDNFKGKQTVDFAVLGFTKSNAIATSFANNNSHSVHITLQPGAKALNITGVDGYGSEQEHLTQGRFRVLSRETTGTQYGTSTKITLQHVAVFNAGRAKAKK